MIRHARTYPTYDQFLSRGRLLTGKLIRGFLQSRLMSAFCKFHGRYSDLIQNYKLSLSHMLSSWHISYQYVDRIWHTDYYRQRITRHSWSWNWAHGGCDQSTGDTYSLRHLIPPLVFPGALVSLIFTVLWIVSFTWSGHWFWLRISSLYLIWRADFDCVFPPFTWFDALILTADFLPLPDLTHWFSLQVLPFTSSRHTDFD
jgi:hypothetical protein